MCSRQLNWDKQRYYWLLDLAAVTIFILLVPSCIAQALNNNIPILEFWLTRLGEVNLHINNQFSTYDTLWHLEYFFFVFNQKKFQPGLLFRADMFDVWGHTLIDNSEIIPTLAQPTILCQNVCLFQITRRRPYKGQSNDILWNVTRRDTMAIWWSLAV